MLKKLEYIYSSFANMQMLINQKNVTFFLDEIEQNEKEFLIYGITKENIQMQKGVILKDVNFTFKKFVKHHDFKNNFSHVEFILKTANVLEMLEELYIFNNSFDYSKCNSIEMQTNSIYQTNIFNIITLNPIIKLNNGLEMLDNDITHIFIINDLNAFKSLSLTNYIVYKNIKYDIKKLENENESNSIFKIYCNADIDINKI